MNVPLYSNQQVKFKSYSFSRQSYIHAAAKESQIVNRQCTPQHNDYWRVTISIRRHLSPAQHQATYKHFARQVRSNGLVMYWVREFKDGLYWGNTWGEVHLHYHGLVKASNICKKRTQEATRRQIKDLLRSALPDEIRPYCEVWLSDTPLPTPKDLQHWVNYILKAKTGGTDNQGRWHDDVLRPKRFLYPHAKVCKLKKVGFIGDFWTIKKTVLWDEIKLETEARHNERFDMQESATSEQRQEAELISDYLYFEYDYALLSIVKNDRASIVCKKRTSEHQTLDTSIQLPALLYPMAESG